MKVRVYFKFVHMLKLFIVRWMVTEDSSPCNSMPMNLLSARNRLRLERDCSTGTKGNRKEGDESEPMQGRLGNLGLIDDAYTVRSQLHSVDPSAWS